MRHLLSLLLVLSLALGTAIAHAGNHARAHVDHDACASVVDRDDSHPAMQSLPDGCASHICSAAGSFNSATAAVRSPLNSAPLPGADAAIPEVIPGRLLRPPRHAL